MRLRLLRTLDDLGHILHLPGFLQDRLCDAWDRFLGVYDYDDV